MPSSNHTDVSIDMSAKDVLKRLMESRAISARKLATETGMNRSTLSSILSGTNESPRDKTLEPLAKFFSVSLGQLRGYEAIEGLSDGSVAPNEYPILDDSNIEKWVRNESDVTFAGTVRSAVPKGPRVFLYVARDNALSPFVPEGGQCFVDPEFVFPDNFEGKKIALIVANGHYALRFESSDLGDKIFKPAAGGFKTLTSDQCRVVGYVVSIPEKTWSSML